MQTQEAELLPTSMSVEGAIRIEARNFKNSICCDLSDRSNNRGFVTYQMLKPFAEAYRCHLIFLLHNIDSFPSLTVEAHSYDIMEVCTAFAAQRPDRTRSFM